MTTATTTVDFGAASRKARAKLSNRTCTAWRKYNTGKISYDDAHEIIQSAEAMCQREIDAAYIASDTRGINVSEGVTAQA